MSMKKISASVFFTVLWRGLCQALGWFFGLFGYKRDGKFAKCVWGLFATSAAIITALMAVLLVVAISETYYDDYYKEAHCYDPDCYHATVVSSDVYYHEMNDGMNYVYNSVKREKTIKDVEWIALPDVKDSLVCYSNGEKRGYFNKYTGKVVIEPKYDHAWIFSEGLASVEEGGYIKFIDVTGKVVIDNKLRYVPDKSEYIFRGGYCVVDADDGEHYGLMDKTGKLMLPKEYNSIQQSDDEFWCVRKGNEMAVLDKELKPIIPLMEGTLTVTDGTINAVMPDHTIRKYTLEGTLINDFYIVSMRMLEYEKDEIVYRKNTVNEVNDEITEILEESYHPRATARLRAYVAGNGYEGLMTADGHVVIMPIYKDINAMGPDLYLCTSTDYDKVIVNGKGEIVK